MNKYIYKLYIGSDGRYNIESKTIIYQNSKYIYFKHNNGYTLESIPVECLVDSINDVDSNFFEDPNDYNFFGPKYLKSYDKNKDKDTLERRSKNRTIDIRRKINKINASISIKETELKRLKYESDILKSQLLELSKMEEH